MKKYALPFVLLLYLLCNLNLHAQTEREYEFIVSSLKSMAKHYNSTLAQEVKAKYSDTENYLKTEFKKAKKYHGPYPNEKLYQAYLKLKELHFAVTNCPKIALKTPKFSERKYAKYRIRAAEEQYLVGTKWLRKKDRESAKQALYHFRKAEKLKQNFRDTPQKIRQAWNLASYQVVIKTDFSPLASQNLDVADFSEKLLQYFENQEFGQPIRFVLAKDMVSEGNQKPDHVLSLKFNYFAVGQTYLKAEKEQISVRTNYYTYKKRIKARGSFILKIVAYDTDKELVNQPLTEQYTWLSEWGICKGEKSELSKVQQINCELTEPKNPSDKVLFEEFCRAAYQKITQNVSEFYQEDQEVN